MIVIPMNTLYRGKTKSVKVLGRAVTADLSVRDGSVVRFRFNGTSWDENSARNWLKKRDYNQILFREHDDGSVFLNSIRLSAKPVATLEGEKAESVLGPQIFNGLMEIESKHGSSKPFLVKTIAMNFCGKDSTIGNGLRFFREQNAEIINSFGGLPIHLGHMGLFEGHKDPVGNTVKPHIDEDGNPSNYMYLYPHGDGAVYRDNFRIAEVQGLLHMYPVSMAGKPIKMRVLSEDEQKDAGDDVYADVEEWEPKAMDIVDEAALEGSQPISIVNRKKELEDSLERGRKAGTKFRRRVLGMETLTMSEILEALSGHSRIALSDLMSVDIVKTQIESHIEREIKLAKEKFVDDEQFRSSVLEAMTDEELEKNERINGLIKNSADKRLEEVEAVKDSIVDVAKGANIELTKVQEFVIRNGIKDVMSENEVLDLIKKTIELQNLEGVPGFSLEGSATDGTPGVTFTEVTADEAAKHI